jgi:hypothetical protein
MQEGKDNEEQDGKPDAVRGQRLGQDGRQTSHRMNLRHGVLWLLHLSSIVPQAMALSQGNVLRP